MGTGADAKAIEPTASANSARARLMRLNDNGGTMHNRSYGSSGAFLADQQSRSSATSQTAVRMASIEV